MNAQCSVMSSMMAKLMLQQDASKFTLSLETLSIVNEALRFVCEHRHEECDIAATFLRDVLENVCSLKLTPPAPGAIASQCSIEPFRNVKTLEMHNVAVHSIDGIDRIAPHLQRVVCTRCLPDNDRGIRELLHYPCSRNDTSMQWPELREATFTYNHLKSLHHFDANLANLCSIDVSHNDLSDASALNRIPNLKYVNLSYNQLNAAPHFAEPLCHRIQVLSLACNFIEEVSALALLTNLRELDVRENCLIEHKQLAPIARIATLQILTLRENPFSYHPQHRMRSVCYLHANTTSVRFVLDGKLLSKSEKLYVGSLHPRALCPSAQTAAAAQSAIVICDKPRNRIRNVTINDEEHTTAHVGHHDIRRVAADGTNHLDTKRQIEELKEQFGNDWLKSQAGSVVQSVLGIDAMTMAVVADTSTTDLYVTAIEDELQMSPSSIDAETVEVEVLEEEEEDDEELADGDESIFLATIKGEEEPVFVVITAAHIIERDCATASETMRWPIDALTTCENDDQALTMYFSTMRKDAQCRKYVWASEESPQLLQALRTIIAQQPDAASNLSVFKCLKCSMQFTLDAIKSVYDERTKRCPSCASDLVFEVEEC